MPYTSLASVIGLLPLKLLIAATDDNKDGVADPDVIAALLTSVDQAINGTLSTRYPVPFAAPYPDLIITAAQVFLIEKIHTRRGASSEHAPWATEANAMRKRLDAIAAGEGSITPEIKKTRPSGTAITEPSKTFSSRGRTPT